MQAYYKAEKRYFIHFFQTLHFVCVLFFVSSNINHRINYDQYFDTIWHIIHINWFYIKHFAEFLFQSYIFQLIEIALFVHYHLNCFIKKYFWFKEIFSQARIASIENDPMLNSEKVLWWFQTKPAKKFVFFALKKSMNKNDIDDFFNI